MNKENNTTFLLTRTMIVDKYRHLTIPVKLWREWGYGNEDGDISGEIIINVADGVMTIEKRES